jgi:hypothetical protein
VIDDPELVAQLREAEADKTVADAELARIMSARARKSSPSARPRSTGPWPISRLHNRPTIAASSRPPRSLPRYKRLDQANLAYQEAVRGFTAEEHKIAEATDPGRRG